MRRLLARSVLSATVPALAAMPVLLRALPPAASIGLGRTFARMSRTPRRQQILRRRNAVLATTDGADAFWRAHLDHVARTIVESFAFDAMTDAEIVSRVDLDGAQHLRDALARGRGAILFLNHLGSPGAIVGGLGLRGYDVTIAGNRMEATVFGERVELRYAESEVQRLFRRGRVHRALLGENLPARMADTLSRNGCFAMFIDFPVVRKHNRRVPFGDASLSVNLGPALLAIRHDAPVLCIDCVRCGDNRHRLTVHAPLARDRGEARESAASRMIEAAVGSLHASLTQHADQWWPWDWADIIRGAT